MYTYMDSSPARRSTSAQGLVPPRHVRLVPANATTAPSQASPTPCPRRLLQTQRSAAGPTPGPSAQAYMSRTLYAPPTSSWSAAEVPQQTRCAPRATAARSGPSSRQAEAKDEISDAASLLFASTLPIMRRSFRPRLPASDTQEASRSAPARAAAPSPIATSCGSGSAASLSDRTVRHATLLTEERETHRKSLDRAWQQRHAAEVALAKAEVEHQQKELCLRAAILQSDEALARSELARAELEVRLEVERRSHRQRPLLVHHTLLPPPLLATCHATDEGADVVVSPPVAPSSPPHVISARDTTSARQTGAASPTHSSVGRRVRGRKKAAAAAASASATIPPGTSSLVRPMTGLVRDSDLLRHLQQAEGRIRYLEQCLAQHDATRGQPKPEEDSPHFAVAERTLGVHYASVTNTLVIVAESDDEHCDDAHLLEG